MKFWLIFNGFWSGNCKNNSKKFCPRRNARGAWILNLPRIRPNSFSHALLPQRGAADSPASRIPPGRGGCLCDGFPIGWLACASLLND